MKHWLLYSLSIIFLFCINPGAKGAFYIKQTQSGKIQESGILPGAEQRLSDAKIETMQVADISSSVLSDLPRGRGNGKGSMKAFLFGWISIFPFLCILTAPFAFKNGIKNMGRIRKGHGFAIAGMILALIGIAFTIAILLVA